MHYFIAKSYTFVKLKSGQAGKLKSCQAGRLASGQAGKLESWKASQSLFNCNYPGTKGQRHKGTE